MKKRILIISDIAPTPDFTAGIIMERIIQCIEDNFLIKFFILHDRSLGNYHVSRYLKSSELFWTTKPREDWSALRNLPNYFVRLGERISEEDAEGIATDIKVQISREMPQHLIVVIQGQSSIKLAESLYELRIPTTYIHWDLWDWWQVAHGLSGELHRVTKERLKLIASHGFHLVPTEEFANYYEISAERFMPLFPSLAEKTTAINKRPTEKIEIAFAGQGYAIYEIQKLISALDSIDWNLDGQRINLNLFGKIHLNSKNINSSITNRGWFHYRDLPSELSNCDLAFLPYPSGGVMSQVAFTSFPSKLCSYSTAKLPILYIGPTLTPTAILSASIGISLDSNTSETEVVDALRNILKNKKEFQQNNEAVFSKYFSGDAFRRTLKGWSLANELGSLDTIGGIEESNDVARHIENFGMLQPLDVKKSNTYFLNLLLLANPMLVFIKIRRKLVHTLRRLIN